MKARRFTMVGVLSLALFASACGRSDNKTADTTPTSAANKCSAETLKATEVGVTADTITIDVMADVNSPLAPGLFKGNWDGMESWAKFMNANGGLGCRKVVINKLDSQLNPAKATSANIQACKEALAMVGSNTLFNPTASDLAKCKDQSGQATGLPDIAALANDANQACNTTTYVIQTVADTCPIKDGVRTQRALVGVYKYFVRTQPGVHGLFLVPGDLPTTLQASVSVIETAKLAGVKWDSTPPVSGSVPQPGYAKFIQQMKSDKSNIMYDGSNDDAMIKFRKEATAQGLNDQVKIWACSLACYTSKLLTAGGSDVEGTYTWMQFLPFEESNLNADNQAYLDGVGGEKNATSWGAQAFQAGQALKQVVDDIIAKDGPNAITRAAILDGLKNLKDFTSNGWIGKKDLRGASPCFVVMQVKGGKFVRVYPEKPGTLDCDESNLTTVDVDPVAGAEKIH